MQSPENTLRNIAQRCGVLKNSLNYLVHYDAERNVAYFETPKVACTSIKKFLQDKVAGAPRELERKGDVHNRKESPIPPLLERSAEEIQSVFFGEVKRISFVRNPYTRLLSGYLDKIVINPWERDRHLKKLGFEQSDRPTLLEVLQALREQPDRSRDIHFASQSRLLLAGDIAFSFIGRFETFAADFAKMKQDFYEDPSTDDFAAFGKHHASRANEKVMEHFGEAEIALAQTIYAADFELLGYSTDLERANEAPTSRPDLRPSLEMVLVRLGLPRLDPDHAQEFRDRVLGEVEADRVTVLKGVDLFLRASRQLAVNDARAFHGQAIMLLQKRDYAGRAANERKRYSFRFGESFSA